MSNAKEEISPHDRETVRVRMHVCPACQHPEPVVEDATALPPCPACGADRPRSGKSKAR